MPDGLHVGQVTKVSGAAVWVTVRSLAPGRQFGPLETLPAVAAPIGDGDYCQWVPALAVGDRVLIGLLQGLPDDPVVVRKL